MMSRTAMRLDAKTLIEAAAKAAGSQLKLAALLGTTAPTLIQMKNGTRPCNWRMRGRLRAILGEPPAFALMSEMTAELERSANEDERRAAKSFRVMLDAFRDGEPTLSGAATDGRP